MKLTKKKILSVIALSTALLTTGSLAAYADITLKQISAYQNAGINLKVNGRSIDLSSDDGMMYPIVYNGHSYVSAKAVAEALGATVKWNNETQTVEITSNNANATPPGVPNKDNTATKNNTDVLHSKWQGTYTAPQGETGATITINGQEATVEIGPTANNPTLPSGTFTASVDYNEETKAITLTGVNWINRPQGWMFVNYVGSISGDSMNGTVTAIGRSAVGTFSFKLVK